MTLRPRAAMDQRSDGSESGIQPAVALHIEPHLWERS